jgi:TPR repeat protein
VPKTVREILLAIMLVVSATAFARADSMNAGMTAFRRGDYVRAANVLGPLALRGHARAQAMLGYLYANGLGTPQSYFAAVDLYSNAAERGNPTAQYLLGLMYDKGLGVIQDEILAYKWLNLAASGVASTREREYYIRLRDAIASKMTSAQIAEGQWLALNWVPKSRL